MNYKLIGKKDIYIYIAGNLLFIFFLFKRLDWDNTEEIIGIIIILICLLIFIYATTPSAYNYSIYKNNIQISLLGYNLVNADINNIKVFEGTNINGKPAHIFLVNNKQKYKMFSNKEKHLEFQEFCKNNNIEILPKLMLEKIK